MANIIKLFLNGIQAQLSKSSLAEDVTSQLLPQVTAADVGKVLTVDDQGHFVLNSMSKPFFVTITESSTPGVMNSDKTYEETLQAYNNGDIVYFCFRSLRIPAYYVDQSFIAVHYNPYTVVGELFVANITELSTQMFIMGLNDGATSVIGGIGSSKFLPIVSSEDNGKFLKVVSSDWSVSN